MQLKKYILLAAISLVLIAAGLIIFAFVQTVFVTKRAALGDWEGKASVPVALPKWFEVYKSENQQDILTFI